MTARHPESPATIALGPRQFKAALATVFLLLLLTALDQMTVSVALPTIAAAMGEVHGVAWVISGYLIASTVVTPIYGKMGDIYGRPAVLTVSLALFMAGAAASAAAPSVSALVLARLVQGAGGGGLVVLLQVVVADIIPLRDRGKYQGYLSMAWAASSVIGPVIGGLLTQYLSWRWIFAMNVPLGLTALWLVRSNLGVLAVGRGGQKVDWVGAALLLVGLIALLIPITNAGQGVSRSGAASVVWLVASAGVLFLFWRRQARLDSPLLPLSLLKHPVVILGCACSFVGFFIFVGMCMLVPMRQQVVAGQSSVQAGAALMWMTLAAPTAVFFGGRWMARTGRVRPLQNLGSLLAALALGWLALIDPRVPWALAVGLVVLGWSVGLQLPTAMLMMQNAVPREVVGSATSLLIFFRALGGAMGIALLSSLVFSTFEPGSVSASPALDGAGTLAHVSDFGFVLALLAQMLLAVVLIVVGRRFPDTRLHRDEDRRTAP